MSWRFLISAAFALVYLVWIWRDRKTYRMFGLVLSLVGSAGILITLGCDYIKTLPSHAPLRTITGLATNRSSLFFDHSHSDFLLIEDKTGRRVLFTTAINGPWADQPVRATYVDDGRFMPSVVRIEILSDDRFPWHTQKGYAGWIGTAEAKMRAPLVVSAIGFFFLLVGAFAPTTGPRYRKGDLDTAQEEAPGESPPNR
jgi:hypothetical protein